jgi:hypothetical protein
LKSRENRWVQRKKITVRWVKNYPMRQSRDLRIEEEQATTARNSPAIALTAYRIEPPCFGTRIHVVHLQIWKENLKEIKNLRLLANLVQPSPIHSLPTKRDRDRQRKESKELPIIAEGNCIALNRRIWARPMVRERDREKESFLLSKVEEAEEGKRNNGVGTLTFG